MCLASAHNKQIGHHDEGRCVAVTTGGLAEVEIESDRRLRLFESLNIYVIIEINYLTTGFCILLAGNMFQFKTLSLI